jgi:tetratricopeptide (TPR) repeat protein
MTQKTALRSPADFVKQPSMVPYTYLLKPNTSAMIRLAFGSATAISTLMCIPDAIGILPTVPDIQTWIIRLIGSWLAAFILWFTGFLGMLCFARIAGGGITLNDKGLKFWRFGKPVLWSNIRAVTVESQPAFSFIFCLPSTARRLMLYEAKPKDRLDRIKALLAFKSNKRQEELKLVTHQIPSFQFSNSEFESLFVHVCEKTAHFVPNAIDAYLFTPREAKSLKLTNEHAALLRKILAVIIAISVVTFLGRKASLNYLSNRGNIYLNQGNYVRAKSDFLATTKIDPTYAMGWDQLARAEYRAGDVAEAENHWHRALFMKPDLLDAKLGLSSILISQGEFAQAKKLLTQCARLLPHNCNIYLNLAEVYSKLGENGEANKLLTVIRREASWNADILSRASLIYLELGERNAAAGVARRSLQISPENNAALSVIKLSENTK